MDRNRMAKNIIIKCSSDFIFPIVLVLGFYFILHGHLTPGGGLQGGFIVSAATVLVFLAYGNEGVRKAFKLESFKQLDDASSVMFTVFALLGILFGTSFCTNVLAKQGNPGELYSSGTIFWMNFSLGLKVLAGISFMLITMMGTQAALKMDKD